ncbi:MAG: 4-(cytidine 5'-diphospho)-2-C-methyl-D-erythritol kinase, partial [Tannerellaceae bacterium]
NAKINLGLNIVSKRPDGYHDIETIFYPIPIKDALEVVPSDTFSFAQTGIPVDAPEEKNLVIRALRLMQAQYAIPPLMVHLMKTIPFGAGLGGGSADAAWMLRLLNDVCRLNLPPEKLEWLASSLGADCPFFIRNRPVFAEGTGNQFTPIDLSLKDYYLCLVKPEIAVSTAEAYAGVRPARPEVSLRQICRLPVADWREAMKNDFERTVFARHPMIKAMKELLYEAGAEYASMSGSGSSVFGLFRNPSDLKAEFNNCFVWEGALG